MPTVNVWVSDKSNRFYLRFLFPNIRFTDDYPVYGQQVFSDYEYATDKTELFLLNTSAGYPIEHQGGLVLFMKAVDYLDERRVELFQRYKYPDIRTMYLEAVWLKLCGKSLSLSTGAFYQRNYEYITKEQAQRQRKEESERSFPARVSAALKLPLAERLEACERLNYANVLDYLMLAFHKFWTRQMAGYQRECFAEDMKVFRRDDFLKGFELSGDSVIDCQFLLTFFRG
jgi:hypothetical protein